MHAIQFCKTTLATLPSALKTGDILGEKRTASIRMFAPTVTLGYKIVSPGNTTETVRADVSQIV